MKKHPYEEPLDPTEQIHQVEGRNDCQNSPLFDFHKTIDPTEGPLEVEDSPEEEDTQEEEGYHREDHQEAVGDHHRYPCPKRIKENWWESHLQYTTEIGRRQLSSSMNGNYTGQSTTTTPS